MGNQFEHGCLGAKGGDDFSHDSWTVFQRDPEQIKFQIEISKHNPVGKLGEYALNDSGQAFNFLRWAFLYTWRQHHEINIGMAFAISLWGQFPERFSTSPLTRTGGL
jgi:hypothetical protein